MSGHRGFLTNRFGEEVDGQGVYLTPTDLDIRIARLREELVAGVNTTELYDRIEGLSENMRNKLTAAQLDEQVTRLERGIMKKVNRNSEEIVKTIQELNRKFYEYQEEVNKVLKSLQDTVKSIVESTNNL